MPELPEVEVVRLGLQQHIAGRAISAVEVLHARATRRMQAPLAPQVLRSRVRCASRRGKYLWLPLDDAPTDAAIIAHLGMSGQLLIQPADAPDEKHLRVRFRFADAGTELRFVDQRTFGGLQVADLVDDDHAGRIPSPLAHIARDPLDPLFDDAAFIRRVRTKRTEIKRALLDQSLISGIGNIYADEALWRAGVHGRRPTWRLSAASIASILGHARQVMTSALQVGGTSFDALYVNVNGQSGYFDRSLQAYGQTDRPCSRCGQPIRRERFMNRSSFFCPRCQRPPRGSG